MLKDIPFSQASLGIANLIVMAMEEEGVSREDARAKIFLKDSRGLIVKDRPSGGVTGHKVSFAKEVPPMETLEEIVKSVKPTVLIGAAAIGGVFTKEILQDMASFNDRPIIFALSNPTSKAECTAEEAYTHTDGRAVFASGSPFDTVVYKGKTYHPGQGNNAYIFPGVALGVICTGIHHIQDELFLMAAKVIFFFFFLNKFPSEVNPFRRFLMRNFVFDVLHQSGLEKNQVYKKRFFFFGFYSFFFFFFLLLLFFWGGCFFVFFFFFFFFCQP